MSERNRAFLATAVSILLSIGVGILWVFVERAASALEALDRRLSAIGEDLPGGPAGNGKVNPRTGEPAGPMTRGVDREVYDLSREFGQLEATLGGLKPIRGSANGTGDIPRESLGQAVESVLATMRRDAVERMAVTMSTAMKGGAIRSVEMNAKFLGVTEEQRLEMSKVFEEEAERCRILLHQTDHHDPEYQAQAREIVERVDARIDAILDPEQRLKYRKLSPDFFGPGLDYERKPVPR